MTSESGEFDPEAFRDFLAGQADLGPKQWPSFVRVATSLPRTETFKVIKRRLSPRDSTAPTRCSRFPGGAPRSGPLAGERRHDRLDQVRPRLGERPRQRIGEFLGRADPSGRDPMPSAICTKSNVGLVKSRSDSALGPGG